MSFILSQIIKKKLLEWNTRPLTEDDFYATCQIQKVRVLEEDFFKYKGEYSIHKGKSIILLQKNLTRGDKLWVGFHELGHHLLHYPVPHRFSKGLYRKMDREANYFAAIALLPTDLIKSKTFGEIFEDYNYPTKLIELRKEIYDHYKI
jgi:Zn-dependent peptidase ImmA (M78 family)